MEKNYLALLSAMITPAVLIMASSSLILATSQRIGRVMENARKLSADFKKLDPDHVVTVVESRMYLILRYTLKRARLLQMALSLLYFALSTFIATSATIGFIDITHKLTVWVPVIFAMIGVLLLLYGSFVLVIESRLALKALRHETDYILSIHEKFISNHG